MKRHWKILSVLGVVVVAGLSVVAVALAATDKPTPRPARGADADNCGACQALADNPEALKAWEALRAEKQKAWQAWFDKYGDNRRSDEAQAALQKLRDTYHDKMQALFDKYGIEAPECDGPGDRAGQRGGMMGGQGGRGRGMGGGGMMHRGGNGGDCDGTGPGATSGTSTNTGITY